MKPERAHKDSARSRVVDVLSFFAIAILLCYGFAMPSAFGLVSADVTSLIVPLLQLTPLIAALIMWLTRRRGSFSETFATRWRGQLPWILAGVGIFAGIAALQTLLALLTGIGSLHPIDQILDAALWLLPVFLLQSVFAIGEEFGWRGWLATRGRAWGFWPLAAVTGLVWMIWHLPALTLIGTLPTWNIVVYFAGMLAWSPLLLALRWRSGSVWAPVFAHGAINSVRVYLLQTVASGTDHLVIEATGWVLTLAAAAWLMRGGRAFGRDPQHGARVAGNVGR